jgi:hypothetical protein
LSSNVGVSVLDWFPDGHVCSSSVGTIPHIFQ